MSVQAAINAGFTKIKTMDGFISLEQWTKRSNIELTFDPAMPALLGAWRQMTTFEQEAAENITDQILCTKARNVYPLE